jgi:uncharacterized membrane protein
MHLTPVDIACSQRTCISPLYESESPNSLRPVECRQNFAEKNMKGLYVFLISVHIVSGMVSLLTGVISVIAKKGGSVHKKTGKVFFFSMIGVGITAIALSILKSSSFLFHIGIFSLYQTIAGYRAVKDKTLRPRALDLLNLGMGTINGMLMVITQNVILIVFGSLNLFLAFRHWKVYQAYSRKNVQPLSWLKMHIGFMMGSYISTVTTFLVVNMPAISFLKIPNLLVWTTPSILLVPLVSYWTWKYTVKPLKTIMRKVSN